MARLLSNVRLLVVIAVAGCLVASIVLMIYGTVEMAQEIVAVFQKGVSAKGAKDIALVFIEIVDLFLLATVFLIIALGLYELFVDDTLPLPNWLQIHDLDDLKDKLLGVVIVVMAVSFLGQVVKWDGNTNLLVIGGGIGSVVASLTWFLSHKSAKKAKSPDGGKPAGG